MALSKEIKAQLDKKACKCAKEIRDRFNLGDNPIPEIYSLELSKEFLLLRFPNDFKISGLYLEKKGRDKIYRCIYINTLEPIGRQKFTFAHELYHVFYEPSSDGVCLENKHKEDPIEYTAERFASYLLLPRYTLARELMRRRINNNTWIKESVLFDIQKIFGVTFQALIYAISDLKNYKEYNYDKLIPKNMQYLFQYNNPSKWDKLKKLTQEHDASNKLNSIEAVFEWPKDFKENILKNIESKKILDEDVKDIVSFFES